VAVVNIKPESPLLRERQNHTQHVLAALAGEAHVKFRYSLQRIIDLLPVKWGQ
jgi:hypothetical protein